ncbi:Putative LOC101163468 [Caligus rogercresseyi]|uniref:RNA-directed DNA polymerase n=1 Tax=Caligus rogercresseyi TaxID=217165 RepID=A0A7T8QTI3_CALRO|nr:Putative LOC101163468 [Caligus rogercresseyi]
MSAHPGISKSKLIARQYFYWPGMLEDIEKEIKGCEVCIRSKERTQNISEPLGQTSTAVGERFTVFHMDLMGPMYNGIANDPKYLLTIQDAFTKFPEAFPIKEPTSENICKILAKEFFPRYGTGMKIVTDRGTQFISRLMREVCDKLGVIKTETQAYQPHTNPVERLHRDLSQAIRSLMVQEDIPENKWHECLGGALAQIRFTIPPRTGYSPFYLVTGTRPVIPATQLDNNLQNAPSSVEQVVNSLSDAIDRVRVRQLESHLKNKEQYDKKVTRSNYKVGDKVFLWAPQTEMNRKLAIHQQGPFLVNKINNDRKITIMTPKGPKAVAKNRLRIATENDISKKNLPCDSSIDEDIEPVIAEQVVEQSQTNFSTLPTSYDDTDDIFYMPPTKNLQKRGDERNEDNKNLCSSKGMEDNAGKEDDKNVTMDTCMEDEGEDVSQDITPREEEKEEEEQHASSCETVDTPHSSGATTSRKNKFKGLLGAAFDEMVDMLEATTRPRKRRPTSPLQRSEVKEFRETSSDLTGKMEKEETERASNIGE